MNTYMLTICTRDHFTLLCEQDRFDARTMQSQMPIIEFNAFEASRRNPSARSRRARSQPNQKNAQRNSSEQRQCASVRWWRGERPFPFVDFSYFSQVISHCIYTSLHSNDATLDSARNGKTIIRPQIPRKWKFIRGATRCSMRSAAARHNWLQKRNNCKYFEKYKSFVQSRSVCRDRIRAKFFLIHISFLIRTIKMCGQTELATEIEPSCLIDKNSYRHKIEWGNNELVGTRKLTHQMWMLNTPQSQ